MRFLAKIVAATILSLTLATVTTGHVSAPILPVSDREFSPIILTPMVDSVELVVPTSKPNINQPDARAKIIELQKDPITDSNNFILDSNVSWYGPGFYGNRTACGYALTKDLLGVAHKTLPCGTLVTFKWGTHQKTVPVVDRGPYAAGRQWDLTGGLCVALDHCFTGQIYYRIE